MRKFGISYLLINSILITHYYSREKYKRVWAPLFSLAATKRMSPRRSGTFFSFPLRTEMFPFRRFAPLACATGFFGSTPKRVSPFGNLGIKGCWSPPPSLSQTYRVLLRLPVPRHPPSAYKIFQTCWSKISSYNFIFSAARSQNLVNGLFQSTSPQFFNLSRRKNEISPRKSLISRSVTLASN